MVKRLSVMRETRGPSLGWEDPLEKEIATHSSTLPGKSHGRRSLVGYIHGVAKSQIRLSNFTFKLFYELAYVLQFSVF